MLKKTTDSNNNTWKNILTDAQNLRTGTVAASLIMALATALPYLVLDPNLGRYTGVKSVSLLYVAGKPGDGFVFILLALLLVIFTLLKKNILILICTAASLLWYIHELIRFSKVNGMMLGKTADLGDFVSKGLGFYFLSLSVIALLVLSVLSLRKDIKK